MMTEHETLNLDALPDLPQSALLKQFAPGLWAAEGVVAMWLGGSLATGTADRYSDVDLFLAHGWFLRLAYIRAAGRDCGDLRYTTIYGLTPVARALFAYCFLTEPVV